MDPDASEAGGETSLLLVDSITARERDVLRLVGKGMSNKEIAENLGMTINTVKSHVKNIYEKLQVNRRVQAVAKAKKLGIL
jgi:RNA polymerase sigma factor (sigma-70 family)